VFNNINTINYERKVNMDNNEKIKNYERPMARVEKTTIDAEEAYSAAAVPAFAPAIEPVVWCGGTIAATVLMKYC